jgi:hypothetical protein
MSPQYRDVQSARDSVSPRQLRTLCYLFGEFWLAKSAVWVSFGVWLWAAGRL